jgi:DNA-binding LacI/PurR family transcriptional regulator
LEIPVPQRLSVMCFCDENASRVMSPGLTFIDLGSKKLGKVAAELLLDQIQHPDQVASQQIVLPEKLMVRSTTAPPNN